MTRRGALSPGDIASELRALAKTGLRPAKVAELLVRLPSLTSLTSGSDAPWDVAIDITVLVKSAIESLGDGPLGRAASALFGVDPLTRGLLLHARRRAAAEELDVETATFVRHREQVIYDEISYAIYAEGIERSSSTR